MQNDRTQFLRNVLHLDALTCLLAGLASLALGGALAEPLGLSAGLLRGSGAVLVAVAAFIVFAARNVPALSWPVWAVVFGNAAWVLASVLVLIAPAEAPTPWGTGYVVAQAALVAVLAELEYVGLRRLASGARGAAVRQARG